MAEEERGTAEFEVKLGLYGVRKALKIQKENQWFGGSMWARNSAEPQKLSLRWASVWGTKIIENSKQNQWFGAEGQRGTAEFELKLGLSMGSENH